MAEFFKKRWKLVLNIVTVLALGAVVYASRHDVLATIDNLGKVNTWALLLMIPIQLLNYHAQTRMYQDMFGVVGNKLEYKDLYKLSLELNFVNHVFPSGGAAGISYFNIRLKNADLTASKATLVHIMKLVLMFVSYEILLIAGMFSLAAMGRVNNLTILVGATISTLLLVGTGLFAYVVGSRARINSFFLSVTKGLNKIIQVVRPRHPETINLDKARDVFEDFHHNYKLLRSSLPKLKAAFWYSLLAIFTEILSVYVVFIAFGHIINVGAVILAYGVANFAGLVSVLPGGVGVYEFLMAAVMATAGVPAALSVPVIVMYRVINTIIQIPPGYYLYQKHLASRRG